jgi:Ca2+-binding RTX toxin-like protein
VTVTDQGNLSATGSLDIGLGNDDGARPMLPEPLYGNDVGTAFTGTSEADGFYGGAGQDTLSGGAGNDSIYGGAGNDVIRGGAGNDTLSGGAGNDSIYGGAGNDVIHGGAGQDTLSGGDGDDTIYGGTDGGVVSGGAGDDLLIVEPGHAATEFLWTGDDLGGFHDTIRGFDCDNDTINLGDIIGDPADIEDLLNNAAWNNDTHTLTVSGTNGSSLTAETRDDKLVLILNTTGGAEQTQTITIEASSRDAFAGFAIDDPTGEAARQLLQEMIQNG